ncbi:four-carbon acid sugar kinase family protein [Nocardiopsis halotolerans]|uniref:four-carbon acid sugar kinase family protein n=1 Tax=Nocardiopsis halotolerans TaxID=124252 RepID=UPI000475C1EF|nr:four-carbon acid sugar kinase family protein [Nocardiopsis halotolerans]
MAQILVLSDDLTGANATGARFARSGMRVASVDAGHARRAAPAYDAVVANLDSRHLDAPKAADLVRSTVERLWPVELVVKRTDTTLRGNVGAELEAAWQAVRDRSPHGSRTRVLFAPAHPASGRITVDGVQLLDGVPLERTQLALDPLNPVRTSVVADIVAQQSDLAVRHLSLGRVTRSDLVDALLGGDEPVVLCDAVTEEHLADIARAAVEASRRDGTVWVAADPGPFGALLARELGLRGTTPAPGPVLAVVGSATELTRRQLDAVAADDAGGSVEFVDIDARRLTGDPGYPAQAAGLLARRLGEASFPAAVVVRTCASAEDVVRLPAPARRAMPGRLAALVAGAVGRAAPSALFSSGGDVTSALLAELGVSALDVGGELVPLAVYGRLDGGPLDATPIITKGGLVGDDDTIVRCLARLRDTVHDRLRGVPARLPSQGRGT